MAFLKKVKGQNIKGLFLIHGACCYQRMLRTTLCATKGFCPLLQKVCPLHTNTWKGMVYLVLIGEKKVPATLTF